MEYKCDECIRLFSSYDSLRKHFARMHKINTEQFYVNFYFNGQWPLCSCGCGNKLKRPQTRNIKLGFKNSYQQGHASRIKNNWGHNENARKKAVETQNKLRAEGKLQVWNKGLTKENHPALMAISKKMIGREITWKDKLSNYASNRTKKHQDNLTKSIKNTVKNNSEKWKKLGCNVQKYRAKYKFNKQEIKFYEEFLIPIFNTDHIKQQQWINGHVVDFIVSTLNKFDTVIEYYGDYWHGNPDKYEDNFIIEQINCSALDKRKNDIARIDEIKQCGYKVIIVWENDVKHSPLKIKKMLENRRIHGRTKEATNYI